MGLLDNLLGAGTAQGAHGGIGRALLGMLADESGSAERPDASSNHSPAAVSGGLNELVQRFEQGGLGDVVRSWIGSGTNQPVTPDQVHQAVGGQTIDRLSQQTGIGRAQLLPLLAQALPLIVDRLTRNQRVPDQHEVATMQSEQAADA